MFICELDNKQCIHVFKNRDKAREYAERNHYFHFIVIEENHVENYIKVKF